MRSLFDRSRHQRAKSHIKLNVTRTSLLNDDKSEHESKWAACKRARVLSLRLFINLWLYFRYLIRLACVSVFWCGQRQLWHAIGLPTRYRCVWYNGWCDVETKKYMSQNIECAHTRSDCTLISHKTSSKLCKLKIRSNKLYMGTDLRCADEKVTGIGQHAATPNETSAKERTRWACRRLLWLCFFLPFGFVKQFHAR